MGCRIPSISQADKNIHFVHSGVELFNDFSFHFDSFFDCILYSSTPNYAYLFLLFFGHLGLFTLSLGYCGDLHLINMVMQKGYPNLRMHALDVQFQCLKAIGCQMVSTTWNRTPPIPKSDASVYNRISSLLSSMKYINGQRDIAICVS